MYHPAMTCLAENVSSIELGPCACLDYMLYTSCCVLHIPCACTYGMVTCLLLSIYVLAIYILMSTTQLDRSRSPTMQPSARMRSEGYSTWSVCLCVCVCVCPPLSSRNYAANKRYERLQRHMGSKNKKVFCLCFAYRHFVARALSCLYARMYIHVCA